MPNWIKTNAEHRRIDIQLFERFSNHCLANTVEPLRAANELAGKRLYDWRYLTLNGASVTSSSGMLVEPDAALGDGVGGDFLFLLPSYGFRQLATPRCLAALRVASSKYDTLAGLDTGSWLLAEAGLLDAKRATVHWHELDGFAERFPDVETVRERFVIDGNRITCGGAMAAFDLICQLIALHHGEALRLEVSFMFMHEGANSKSPDLTTSTRNAAMKRAIALMRENLEEPLSIAGLARRVGLTQRRLEQGFRRDFGATPRAVYRRLRLVDARKLIAETHLPVAEISVRCGYADPSAMTRAFVAEFGQTPRAVRSNLSK